MPDGRFLAAVKQFLGVGVGIPVPAVIAEPEQSPVGLHVYKDTNGSLRWFAWVSNKYRDRDGEIITDGAHREYVAYVDETKDFPELQTWHTPGTRYGIADWVDYADGFLLMSGTVDDNLAAKAVAERLEGRDLGVSHGFLQAYSDKANGIIGWYRDFEVSSLPPAAAANVWTQLGLLRLREEAAMGFRADKRAHLVELWGEERVAALEKDTAGRAKALEAAGIDFKEVWTPDPAAVAEPAPVAPPALSLKDIGDAAAKAILDSPVFQGMNDTLTAVKANSDQVPTIAGRITALEETVKGLKVSDDEKIAGAFTAAVKAGTSPGYRASQDPATAVKEGDPVVAAVPNNTDWLSKALL